MTPEVIESRLLLRAMTLRGIGSYLYGARLEIRPLTILCGTNGSGKSTWFRMLNLLRRSLEEGRLPFSLVDEVEGARQRASWNPYQDAYDVRCPGYTNALFLRGSGGDLAGPTDAEELPLYGPEGTIGLEMLSARDLDLEDRDAPRKSRRNDLWTFLSEGYAARGSSFRVRLTVPDNDPSFIEGIRWFESGAELLFGKDELVRLRQEEEGGPHRLRVSEPLLASLQRTSLMPEAWTQSNLTEDGITLVHVADVSVHEQGREVYVRRVLSELGELGLDLCRLFVVRLRQLLTILFSGTFYVGPIRELQQKLFLSPEEFHDDEPVAKRKVGATGAATHTLIRYFADTPMHRASPPYSGLVTPESQSFGRYDFSADYVDAFLKRARRPQPSLERRIWELGSRALGMLATPPAPPEADDGTWMAGLFNAVLDSPDLLGDFDPPAGVRPEFHSLLDRTRGNVHPTDRRRLNHLLLRSFSRIDDPPYDGFTFETYVSVWLRYLLRTGIKTGAGDLVGKSWDLGAGLPAGFLYSTRAEGPPWGMRGQPEVDPHQSLERFAHDCFGTARATPYSLSAGFHQVAPILVQVGLMMRNEMVLIENPEVHLHPGLQLKLAEFLVQESNIGKVILVETHSDLVVRRALRAIFQEELGRGQESVRIYFSSLERDEKNSVACSRLELLKVDSESGHILNWPEGFLDDDVLESRRLMEAMYPRYFGRQANRPEDDDAA